MQGIVFRSTGSWHEVLLEDGKKVQAKLRGKLKLQHNHDTHFIAVGDKVIIELDGEQSAYSIHERLPRSNYLARRSSTRALGRHIMGSNITQVLALISLRHPLTSTYFLDNILIAAERFLIPVLIVFTKHDTYAEKEMELMQKLTRIYTSCPYPVCSISLKNEASLNALKASMNEQVNLMVGQSGAGKSSLLNHLIPGLATRTNEINRKTKEGVHTTTHSEMYACLKNAFLIDTPGCRDFFASSLNADEELMHSFPEFRPFQGLCKFANCTHIHEGSCAVLDALKQGRIDPARHHNYVRIFNDFKTGL